MVMEKLKVESLVSAEVRVSNADSTTRTYDISAVVRVDNGNVTSISQGQVKEKNSTDGMLQIASFDSWQETNLNVQFQQKDGRADVLSEIEAFILKCRTDSSVVANAVTEQTN